MFPRRIALLLALAGFPAAAGPSIVLPGCAPGIDAENDAFGRFAALLARLPAPGVDGFPFAAGLEPLRARHRAGFAELPLDEWFPAPLMQAIYDGMPRCSRTQFPGGSTSEICGGRQRFGPVLDEHRQAPFLLLLNWITAVVTDAFREETPLVLDHAQVRAMTADDPQGDAEWHIDGRYLSASIALTGEGSLYFPDFPAMAPAEIRKRSAEWDRRTDFRQAPRARLLILTALDRVKAQPRVQGTVHRSPTDSDRRLFFIVRYRIPDRP